MIELLILTAAVTGAYICGFGDGQQSGKKRSLARLDTFQKTCPGGNFGIGLVRRQTIEQIRIALSYGATPRSGKWRPFFWRFRKDA